uniref:Aldehyde oxidase/xanthine dehydrogenase second molybdopterin binding domain-containing protein n=1 Tax=Glycine max TaxID=3847 RepID=A0A0R0L204_SOYBN
MQKCIEKRGKVATSCALAAKKLQHPVRMYQNRKTDMIMAGGRYPMKKTYSVGIRNDGKITALDLQILFNAGIYVDISAIMPHNIVCALKKSSMRGPGEVQGSFTAEAIIENVAATLSMDVDSVRSINLHTYKSLLQSFSEYYHGEPYEYTLPSIWSKLAVSSNYDQRNKMVQDGSRSLDKGETDGCVYALGAIQCDGTEGLLDKIWVVQSDTVSLIQGGFTAGSTTSESSCEAVRLSCNVLVKRLKPLKEKLQEEMDSIKWETLILQAYMQAVNLSASSFYVPSNDSSSYLNYGAAVSEVEIDLLNGETRFLQTDIIYDCGQSLNPAVDLGQNTKQILMVWNYKIPTIDTIPKRFTIQILNSGYH